MTDYHVYDALEKIYQRTGCKIVVDSAFRGGKRDFMIKSAQGDPVDGNCEVILENRAATSIRQLSEWGMRMVQGQFPRVADTLIFDESGDRRVVMRIMVHLYNFQCCQVGQNEILNSFMQKDDGYFGHEYISPTVNNLIN